MNSRLPVTILSWNDVTKLYVALNRQSSQTTFSESSDHPIIERQILFEIVNGESSSKPYLCPIKAEQVGAADVPYPEIIVDHER